MARVVQQVRVKLLRQVRLIHGSVRCSTQHSCHMRVAGVAGHEALIARDVLRALVGTLVQH